MSFSIDPAATYPQRVAIEQVFLGLGKSPAYAWQLAFNPGTYYAIPRSEATVYRMVFRMRGLQDVVRIKK